MPGGRAVVLCCLGAMAGARTVLMHVGVYLLECKMHGVDALIMRARGALARGASSRSPRVQDDHRVTGEPFIQALRPNTQSPAPVHCRADRATNSS